MRRVTVGRVSLLIPERERPVDRRVVNINVEIGGAPSAFCYFDDDVEARAFCEELVAAGRAMLILLGEAPP